MTEIDTIRAKLFDQVLAEGVVTHWVDGDPDSTLHRGVPWAYTIGRTLAGRPELLVTGLDEEQSRAVLGHLADIDCEPDHPEPSTPVGPVAFIRAETGLLYGTWALFGTDFTALQVIWWGGSEQPIHTMGGLIMSDPYPEEY